MPVPVLATKLYIPPLRSKVVIRPRLLEQLSEGLLAGRKLALISAPAGFGKTTLVSEWIATLTPASGRPSPSESREVAWLSLDDSDNDLARFLKYFVAALQTVAPHIGAEVLAALHASQPQPPPAEALLTTLLNEIAAISDRVVLVLDDYHVIDSPPIDAALTFLIDHLPPQLQLVITTREDPSLPLARLRARGQLTELRAADLRFTPAEAAEFLNQSMGLDLSADDIAALEDRTEGWIVGLQLAALSVRDRSDRSGFIAALSGSHRYILSYLTAEVLDRQPAEIRQFLLDTAILDQLNGDLCNVVTGHADSHALLEQLLSANLFLLPMDDERRWYRYHHLFADLLRDRQRAQQPDRTADLHRRASQWYAAAGLASEAITHALAAADYALAARLLEEHATDLLTQGHLKAVESWLKAIPPQLRAQSPRVNLAFAWMHLMRGTLPEAAPYVEQLQALFADFQWSEADTSLHAEWLALQAYLLITQGKPAEAVAPATQALSLAPETDDHVRSLAGNALGSAYLMLDDYTRAVDVYQKTIQHSRVAGHIVSEVMGLSVLTQVALQRGQLHAAFDVASQGVDRLERVGSQPPISAMVYGALGQVHYHWQQIEQARRQIVRALQLCALGGYHNGEIYHRALLSRLLLHEGNLKAAQEEIQQAFDLMQSGAPIWAQIEIEAQRVRVYLAQDRLTAAEAVLKPHGFSFEAEFTYPDLAPEQSLAYTTGLLYNSVVRVLLYRARIKRDLHTVPRGIELAGQIINGAQHGQYRPLALEALLLRAQLHAALGDKAASLADIDTALHLAEPEGFISVFVEEGAALRALVAEQRATIEKSSAARGERSDQSQYLDQVLAAFPTGALPVALRQSEIKNPKSEILVEPLTPRELEVLRLIAAGDSNQAIADKLVITLRAVKKHTGNIYGKLNVSSRTQAVARARQLALLPSDE
jgi:LuxR family maltose regulon positive regulatory protein